MSARESDGSEAYLVNTARKMDSSKYDDSGDGFYGTHNDYLANRLKPKVSAADRFVSLFFWVAVVAVVGLIAILIASIVLESRQGKLLPITSYHRTFTLADGTVLAAIVTHPVVDKVKRPVVFELTHKRLRDANRKEAFLVASDLAARGLIVIQVDARGTGMNVDTLRPAFPFTIQDVNDAVDLAKQFAKSSAISSSNGGVGMFGLGASANLALLAAQQDAKAVQTVVALHAPKNMFWDDAYPDGNFMPSLQKARTEQLATLPAGPAYTLDPTYFQHRFNIVSATPYLFKYLDNQVDNAFYEPFTVQGQLINAPIYLIAGLYSQYKDFALDIYQTRKTTIKTKVVIGPFDNSWPNESPYNSRFNARADVAAWFKQWLADEDNGFMREPDVVMFESNGFSAGPSTIYPGALNPEAPGKIPIPTNMFGRWQFLGWPIAKAKPTAWTTTRNPVTLTYNSASGYLTGYAWGPLTGNQTVSYGDRVFIEHAVTSSTINLNGYATYAFSVKPLQNTYASWHVRVEDIGPDGEATLVTGGSFNEAMPRGRQNSTLAPQPEPNVIHQISGRMHYATWAFAVGHRIRFTISNSAPGMAWSAPTQGPMQHEIIFGADSKFELPTAVPRVGRPGRTPKFVQATIPATPASPTYVPYNRTFAIDRVQLDVAAGHSTAIEAEGTYFNSDDAAYFGFVGQTITSYQNDPTRMTYVSQATNVLVPGVNSNTPSDPPGKGDLYLHDLLSALQQKFTYDLAVQALTTNTESGAIPIPNIALSTRDNWVLITTTTTIEATQLNFNVTITREASRAQVNILPPQSANKIFPRNGH